MSCDQFKKGLGSGGTITMSTFLMEFHLGASFHAIIVDLPFKELE
jgi:hypothetical protein